MNLEGLIGRLDELHVSGFSACTLLTHVGAVVGIHSYRGYYEQLQLTCSDGLNAKPWRVDMLLTEARALFFGKIYTGYKGGDYTARPSTPIWVDRYGECNGRALISISTPVPPGSPALVEAVDISDYA